MGRRPAEFPPASVIVPVKGPDKNLRLNLALLAAQDYPDYELIVMPMMAVENKPPEAETPAAEPVNSETSQPAGDNVTSPAAPEAGVAETAQAVAEAEAIVKADKPKRKHSKAKEPVAVA